MTSLTVPITAIDCHAHVMRCDAPLAPDRHSAPKHDCTNAPATRKFLDDAGEQLLIRKGTAFRQYIDAEYDALGKLAKALNLSPQ